jgi:hypothetical protein
MSVRRSSVLAKLCLTALACAFLWGAGSAVAADRLVFAEGFTATW